MQPVSVTSNLLHPKYRGCKLCANEIGIANEYLLELLYDEGLNQLTDYKNGKGIFSKLFNRDIKSPTAFWHTAEHKAYELSKAALKVAQIPACIIDLKCHFLGRKNLSPGQLDKLINLYYDLRIRDSKQSENL